MFWKICEKLFLSEKNPTSSVKIGGFCRQKMFRKFFETSLILSLEKENLLILAVLRKTFFLGKNYNFNFQKWPRDRLARFARSLWTLKEAVFRPASFEFMLWRLGCAPLQYLAFRWLCSRSSRSPWALGKSRLVGSRSSRARYMPPPNPSSLRSPALEFGWDGTSRVNNFLPTYLR